MLEKEGKVLRILRSLILGLALGVLVGLYFGWFQFPGDARSSSLSDLSQHYRDDYVVMIAAGYAADGDRAGAVERLSFVSDDEAPTLLRETAERVIQTSSRGLADIRLLVQLADALGQYSAIMEPFLDVSEGRA